MNKNITAEQLRMEVLNQAKIFKAAWTPLAQGLYSIWRDKLYHGFGYEEFEDYVVKELGIRKQVAMKMVKVYFFVEQEESTYLKPGAHDEKDAHLVPGMDALDVLRKARQNKDLTRDDYVKIRKDVFEKGKHEGLLTKDLTALIKERKQVDPDEEREKRGQKSINNVVGALRIFNNDMRVLKLVPDDIVNDSEELLVKLRQSQR